MKVLRIDASARHDGSKSRAWADEIITALRGTEPIEVVHRDLGRDPAPHLDEATLRRFGDPSGDAEPTGASELSRIMIEELELANAIVVATPIYNFSIPAALKAWLDLIARARRTFRYTDNGPRGQLVDRPVYLIVVSGGTQMHSEVDFATPYLLHVLGFLGLHDIRIIDGCGSDRTDDDVREDISRALRMGAATG